MSRNAQILGDGRRVSGRGVNLELERCKPRPADGVQNTNRISGDSLCKLPAARAPAPVSFEVEFDYKQVLSAGQRQGPLSCVRPDAGADVARDHASQSQRPWISAP